MPEPQPQHHNEYRYPENPFGRAVAYWEKVAQEPSKLLVTNPKIFRTALGHGVTLLTQTSDFFKKYVQPAIKEGKVTIAGVEFTANEINWIGQYYASIAKNKGLTGACMDERLDESKDVKTGIHKECGAAAAISQLTHTTENPITGETIENLLMADLGVANSQKTGLIDNMKHHEAFTFMMTFGPQPYSVDPAKYDNVRAEAALPFHTFVSVEDVARFAQENNIDKVEVFKALVKWNAQIAINIMKGDHNHYKDEVAKNGVIALMDYRDIDKELYKDMFLAAKELLNPERQQINVTQIEINS